jgi:SAM-dependent methyltransferase
MKEGVRGYERSAHLYDLFDQKENIHFFLHYGLKAGEILDIGVGTGRIAIPLAQEGVKVFCVEPSPAMRAVFEEKISKQRNLKSNIVLIDGLAKGFDFGRTFPAAYLSGTFDHFLDDDERLASLLNIRKHLSAKGVLIFDAFVELMREKPLAPADEVCEGRRVYKRFVGAKLLPGSKLEVELLFQLFEKDVLVEEIEEKSLVAVIDRKGISELLERAGFLLGKEFGDYSRCAFQEGDGLIIIEAVKDA